jgi:hypothetical protein
MELSAQGPYVGFGVLIASFAFYRFFFGSLRLNFAFLPKKTAIVGEPPKFNVKHILFTAELFIYIKK